MEILKRVSLVLPIFLLSAFAEATAPVAVDDNATTDPGQSVKIELLANDTDAEGDPISIQFVGGADNGSVDWVEGSSFATYTPNSGFANDTDTFTYTIVSIDSITEATETDIATVTVTVNAITEEPSSQTIENEVTGTNNKKVAGQLDLACDDLIADEGSPKNLRDRCLALAKLAEESPEKLNDILRMISPEEMLALKRVSSESTRMQMDKVSHRMQQRKVGGSNVAFSLNGYDLPINGGAAGDSSFPEYGVFASAHYSDVERDSTSLEAGYEYSATGVTMGVDRRFTPALLAGVAVGWTKHDLDYDGSGGSTNSDLYSVTLYTTSNWRGLNLDVQAGTERGSFDTQRNIQYDESGTTFDAKIKGNTDAAQYFASLQADYPISLDALSLTPYVRADYITMDIDAFEETGGEGYEMAVDEQTLKQYTFKAGLDASYAISQDWGVLLPYVGLSVVNETSNNYGSVSFVFVQDPNQQSFELGSEGEENLFYQLRVGSSAVLARGWSVFGDYSQILGYENTTAFQVNVGLRYEL
ncbi:autotransporter outer membrane beta-barrel domain-containing protein [Hahella sp. CCB-MM4]|uniref:autotransporter outer membrane beta-barrel domain-containing protein n=1 Tax=Hahella sp. (strain CCB-MM4) TaxID=1926491 RepID=UPI000B9A4F1E|nr:autotransporter outer membrane beta-barrel domain-containing protein [Hahella sp. CCB-MM4]OZG73210.1 autotransporter outer membrane beta-barrel domain-containing protein [Hahella sp. CCB-MM4]